MFFISESWSAVAQTFVVIVTKPAMKWTWRRFGLQSEIFAENNNKIRDEKKQLDFLKFHGE